MARSPLLTALLHPVNLSMLALMVAAGLCSAWWLLPIGFILWLIMVIVIARDPGLHITFSRQNRQPLSQRFQTRFDRLDRARITIFNAISRFNSPAMQKVVEPVTTELDRLVEHAYQLCLRLSALDNNYTIQQLTGNYEEEYARLMASIETAPDEASKNEFKAALQSFKTQETQVKAVGALLKRFEAQLTGTTNAVEGIVTNVVSFQGRDPKQVAVRIPALLEVIQTEQAELDQFDAELENSPFI
jgi:hypothetical protein